MEKSKEVPTTELFLLRDATEDLSHTEVLVDEILIWCKRKSKHGF